jgi:hypothetical protein
LEAKLVYIAYPLMSGTQSHVLYEIGLICARARDENVIPFVPYLHMFFGEFPSQEEIILRRKTIEKYFAYKCVSEVWVFGDRLLEDTIMAVRLGHRHGIPVVPKTHTLKKNFTVSS